MARKSQLAGPAVNGKKKLNGKEYARELRKLQTELVEMQEWVKATGARIVVVFEGGFKVPFPGEKTVRPASDFNKPAPAKADLDD
ncbi:MAG: hypothetical protein WA188_05610 [Terriglobales bacterium]